MKPTPFNPQTDLAPVPFEPDVLAAAQDMKREGLEFRPHVGCFVWDPDEVIEATSPFPERVFFILNLGRFEQLLGSVDAIAEKLVWVPTENQARWIIRRLGGDGEKSARGVIELYAAILKLLESAKS